MYNLPLTLFFIITIPNDIFGGCLHIPKTGSDPEQNLATYLMKPSKRDVGSYETWFRDNVTKTVEDIGKGKTSQAITEELGESRYQLAKKMALAKLNSDTDSLDDLIYKLSIEKDDSPEISAFGKIRKQYIGNPAKLDRKNSHMITTPFYGDYTSEIVKPGAIFPEVLDRYVETYEKIKEQSETFKNLSKNSELVKKHKFIQLTKDDGIATGKNNGLTNNRKPERKISNWCNTWAGECLSSISYEVWQGLAGKVLEARHAEPGYPGQDYNVRVTGSDGEEHFIREGLNNNKITKEQAELKWDQLEINKRNQQNAMHQEWTKALKAETDRDFWSHLSNFAYLHANLMPYERGSATILETRIWAAAMLKGYQVEVYDKGIDFYALSSLDETKFNLKSIIGVKN